jgi:hypothetical protein
MADDLLTVLKFRVPMGPAGSRELVGQRRQWCADQFGERFTDWDVDYAAYLTQYCFRREQDAFLFALRWQGLTS